MLNKKEKILLYSSNLWSFASGMFGPIFAIFAEKIGGNIRDITAAWAIYLMDKMKNESWPGAVKNRIAGIHVDSDKPNLFQDPIAWGAFTIFEQGYAEGLIIPKKPKYWIDQQ